MSEEATGIPATWINTTIGSISKVKGGKRLPKGETLIQNKNSHPYIRITDFQDNSINKNQLQFVPNKTFEKISRYIVNENDVIISIVGTIGLVAKIDKDLNNASLTENCVKLIDLKKVDSDYLFFYLTSRIGQSEINKNTVGAVQKKLPIYGVQNINITLPPLQEQKAIANVLTAFDDKIENLRAQNDTLEQTAQTIFTEWFGKYKLDDELPEGWRVGKLGEVITLIGGGTPKTSIDEYWDGEICWYSVVDVPRESDCFVIETLKKITPLGLEKSSTKLLRKGTTIISARGTVGKLAITGLDMAMNQSCYGIQGQEEYGDYFTYYLVKDSIKKLENNVHGAVFDTITKSTFDSISKVIPNPEIALKFEKLVIPIMTKILNNVFQTQSLAKTRDTLLPKLMSGQLRVKNVETLELAEK